MVSEVAENPISFRCKLYLPNFSSFLSKAENEQFSVHVKLRRS